jgi:methylated-DNA-[protein]-cysteine S-methyltransferase|tara:strand:- start:312 stop:605 length:294 start_codon:yes stop_codon:yes gene_type:complete
MEKKIYKKLLTVPHGKITTYNELSKSIGLENGQRLVGQIMKKNPFPVIIPCHRVIKSNGDIGGYLFGIDIKKNMLRKEGICIIKNKIDNFKDVFFTF